MADLSPRKAFSWVMAFIVEFSQLPQKQGSCHKTQEQRKMPEQRRLGKTMRSWCLGMQKAFS